MSDGLLQVYSGYVDDPRNTDNAWMETFAMNFHDDDGSTLARFKLQSGEHGDKQLSFISMPH